MPCPLEQHRSRILERMKRALLCFGLLSGASCAEHASPPRALDAGSAEGGTPDSGSESGVDTTPDDAAGAAGAGGADVGPAPADAGASGTMDSGPTAVRTHGLLERVE